MFSGMHASVLSTAFENVLTAAEPGAISYVTCLAPATVESLSHDHKFSPNGWLVRRVADEQQAERTISAGGAVEMREGKDEPVLLLVDTSLAGAGMAGIYNAAQNIDESRLFKTAISLALDTLAERMPDFDTREDAQRAINAAKGHGNQNNISPWAEFDFIISCADAKVHPGALAARIGLWPIKQDSDGIWKPLSDDDLYWSRNMVDRLLGASGIGLVPMQRIDGLNLANDHQKMDLVKFLRSVRDKTVMDSLEALTEEPGLWVNALNVGTESDEIESVELVSWRGPRNRILRWPGLNIEINSEELPTFILDPDVDDNGNFSTLEVRWKASPASLIAGSVDYRVTITTDMDQEIASKDINHAGGAYEKCRFTDHDFPGLSEGSQIPAKVVISVVGNVEVSQEIEPSEYFIIKFGEIETIGPSQGGGKTVRTFTEGLIESIDRQILKDAASYDESLGSDNSGYITRRTSERRAYKVYRPDLVRKIDETWPIQNESIGRWRLTVRPEGVPTSEYPEFVPLSDGNEHLPSWSKANAATKKIADRLRRTGSTGQVYDHSIGDTLVRDYLNAWTSLLSEGGPSLALVNTVEICDVLGKTIGLIVLPSHPLRVAWNSAYDNLVIHARFEQGQTANVIRKEFSILDGAMFPPFLPGLNAGSSFVFGDTFGFHTVGMVLDTDKEPKASIALLALALGIRESDGDHAIVGRQTGKVLGNEIRKYIDSHEKSEVFHIHALRAGDGMSVALALGDIQNRQAIAAGDDGDESDQVDPIRFVLELYPSLTPQGRAISGRFFSELNEARRAGSGALSDKYKWMLESINKSKDISVPKLRWATMMDAEVPESTAHVAIAFDTFESQVMIASEEPPVRPYMAYGLLSYLERRYRAKPSPLWISWPISSGTGEKHPVNRQYTDRLVELQKAIDRCVSTKLGDSERFPIIRTEITADKSEALKALHESSDWVLTIDRNSGIEYFDSPSIDDERGKERYESYVIDCVPEREDMGSLQLITSTSDLDEVRDLADDALDRMGLSRSLKNSEFLLDHLKALSGRLAMRLTSRSQAGGATSELIALATSHANCEKAAENHETWMSLRTGFLVPVDDVPDLIPTYAVDTTEEDEASDSQLGNVRPDLIHVSITPRRGLCFRFIEVKNRRTLSTARNHKLISDIQGQTEGLRKRWGDWYIAEDVPAAFRSVRLAKLARVLRFYADKAHRYHMDDTDHQAIVSEIDKMLENGARYRFGGISQPDRGWVFCPEFKGNVPEELSHKDSNTRVFLFGDQHLPDSASRIEIPGSGEHDGVIMVETGGTHVTPQEDPLITHYDPPESDRLTEEPIIGNLVDGPADPTLAEEPDTECTITLGEDIYGSEVSWKISINGNPHLLIAGLPGTGKTTFLERTCLEMLKSGVRPIIFSYHPDIDEVLKKRIPEDKIRFLDLDGGLGFNPLQVLDRSSRLGYLDVAGIVRDIFSAIYPDLGEIQLSEIRTAIKQSFEELGWGSKDQDLTKLVEPEFGRFLEILNDRPNPNTGLRHLLLRLEELEERDFFETNESTESLWDSERPVVIVCIHRTQDDGLQRAFASMVFYRLYKDMFKRTLPLERITHSIIFDEAHRAARMKLIPTMAKECRKYGISLVLASQEAKDFNDSLFSAVGNYLALRLNETDAKAIVKNVASSDQEKKLVNQIKQMDSFKAVFFPGGRRTSTEIRLYDLPEL